MNVIEIFPTSDRLALILDALCRAVAARFRSGVMTIAMIALVWKRIKQAEVKLQGLLARYRAGRLPTRPAPRAVTRLGVRGPRQSGAANSMPRSFAWLLPLVPSEAAAFAGQLRVVLAEPDMVGLLAASAQARRILRPVCRMLGIEAGMLEPPVCSSEPDVVLEATPEGSGGAVSTPDRPKLPPPGPLPPPATPPRPT